MISIYGGLIFGAALKRLGLGKEADAISDLFIDGFCKFLQYTIPLAVFGSITLALNSPSGVDTLLQLIPILKPYLLTMITVWVAMIIVTTKIQGKGLGYIWRGVYPQAVVAFSTSSSMATLPATKKACYDLGADGDEATPYFTIGATVIITGTVIGLLLATKWN